MTSPGPTSELYDLAALGVIANGATSIDLTTSSNHAFDYLSIVWIQADGVEPIRSDVDTDADGIVDSLDIDSDNDGITDNIEAQTTAGYTAPLGTDADADGLDDAYDTSATTGAAFSLGVTPVDTDLDGTPDLRDTDSDNDSISDTLEAGLAGSATGASSAANDADGDGLFDVFDTQNSTSADDGFVVNEGLSAGALAYPDTDGDAASAIPLAADVDFRDNNVPPSTTNGAAAYAEDTPIVFQVSDFNFADADAGDQLEYVRIDGLPSVGTLEYNGSPVSVGASISRANLSNLQYVPSINQSASDSFDFSVGDDAQFSASATFFITATPSNNSPVPVIAPGGNGTVIEAGAGDPVPFALTTGGAPVEISVGDLAAQLVIDDIEQTEFGIGVIAADETSGVWQYKRTDIVGHDWTDFQLNDPGNLDPTPVPDGEALLMDPDALIRFVPDANFSGTANFQFRIWDQTVGTASNPPSTILDDSGGAPPTATSSLSSTVFLAGTATDYDGDGMADVDDLDDDNDGILDVGEMIVAQGTEEFFENPTNVPFTSNRDGFDAAYPVGTSPLSNFAGSSGYFTNADLTQSGSGSTVALLPAYEGNYYSGLHSGENFDQEVIQLELDIPVSTGQEVGLSFAAYLIQFESVAGGYFNQPGKFEMFGIHSGSTATTGSEAPNSATNIDTTTSTSIGLHPDVDKLGETGLITNTTAWQEYVISFTATADYDRILIVPTSAGVNSGGPNPLDISTFLAIDAVNFGLLTDVDTDTDGVIDRLDIDSDNDGVSDLIESGQDYTVVDANNDGVHDGGVDADGIPVAANGGVTSLDTDGDGLVDRLDLDSDGDLIPDQVEAQPTAGYQSLTNVNNAANFGVNDIALFAPSDTDGDGTFDFRDLNSDSDGKSDLVESGLTATGVDANGDGADDVTATSYGDGDGSINNPQAALANEVRRHQPGRIPRRRGHRRRRRRRPHRHRRRQRRHPRHHRGYQWPVG